MLTAASIKLKSKGVGIKDSNDKNGIRQPTRWIENLKIPPTHSSGYLQMKKREN